MGFKTYTCPIAKSCGGCEWLQVPYPIQLKRKQAALEELFFDIAQKDQSEILPILGMDEPHAFRYKAATPFAPGPNKRIRSGFYAQGTHRIVPCSTCLTEDPRLRPILNQVAFAAQKCGIWAYDEDRHTGVLRHAVARSALYTDDILLTVVTNSEKLRHKEAFVKEILKGRVRPTTIVQNINTRQTNAILGSKNITLFGRGTMRDKILGATFEIGATSFYQTNPKQTEVLYKTALDMAHLESGMHVLDAYCGCGTIGICAGHLYSGLRVLGVEKGAEAVKLARKNARINHLEDRCRFVQADATEYMTSMTKHKLPVDVLIMDPPRAGSTEAFLNSANRLAPERIVYISCNPTTQVRDIAYIRLLGWKVEAIQAVDMFPQTKHMETICLLTQK